MNDAHHPHRGPRGFSLIEILVAVSVMALLVLLVSQLVQSGSAVIAGSRKDLSADAQAREVFNRFALDVAQMAKRADLDAVFSDQPGNKKIFFFSESPGFASSPNASSLSLVGYRVDPTNGLERLGKGLDWTGTGAATFLTYASTNAPGPVAQSTIPGSWSAAVGTGPAYEGSDPDYHPIAPGVFRLEYCFQMKDGSYSLARDPTKGFRDVAAIVLSLGVLDGDSRKIAPDTSGLAGALPSPTAGHFNDKVLPAAIWRDLVTANSSFASAAGIPEAAAGRVRVYQRAFPLNLQ